MHMPAFHMARHIHDQMLCWLGSGCFLCQWKDMSQRTRYFNELEKQEMKDKVCKECAI